MMSREIRTLWKAAPGHCEWRGEDRYLAQWSVEERIRLASMKVTICPHLPQRSAGSLGREL